MITEIQKLKDGNTLEIHLDSDADNPRNWDNLAQFFFYHKRYTLGDEQDLTPTELSEAITEDDVVRKVYAYTKRGIALATTPFSCPWDSGLLGYAVVWSHDIVKEYGELTHETREKALKVLEAELETYDQYLNGETYGYILKDSEGEELDSCWGFYGHDPKVNGIYDAVGIKEDDVA